MFAVRAWLLHRVAARLCEPLNRSIRFLCGPVDFHELGVRRLATGKDEAVARSEGAHLSGQSNLLTPDDSDGQEVISRAKHLVHLATHEKPIAGRDREGQDASYAT